MNESLTVKPAEILCQEIENGLRAEGVGYGKNKSLWEVSPFYFLVSSEQFEQMKKTTLLFQQAREALADKKATFYLRGDFVPLQDGRMIPVEFNHVPVGEGEITALRKVYKSTVDYPDGYEWPFDEAATVMANLLKSLYPNKRIGILIPPRRLDYLKDYLLLATYAKRQGVDIRPIHTQGVVLGIPLQKADVIYRAFQSDDLPGWREGEAVWQLCQAGKIDVFPPFSETDPKEVMARIFMNEGLEINGGKEKMSELKENLPWTWLVDQKSPPCYQGEKYSWRAVAKGWLPVPLVAKAVGGREAKKMYFSSLAEPLRWEQLVHCCFLNEAKNGVRQWIIQEDLYGQRSEYSFPLASGLRGGLGARVCFTVAGEKSDRLEVVDADVSLLEKRVVHTTSSCLHLPALVGGQ